MEPADIENNTFVINILALLLFIVLILMTVFTCSYYYAHHSPWRIKQPEAEKLLEKRDFDYIFDVRSPVERRVFGFYPGSIPVSISSLQKRVKEIIPEKDKHAKILTYCMSGQRAKYVTNKLQKWGYTHAFYVTYLPVMNKSSTLPTV